MQNIIFENIIFKFGYADILCFHIFFLIIHYVHIDQFSLNKQTLLLTHTNNFKNIHTNIKYFLNNNLLIHISFLFLYIIFIYTKNWSLNVQIKNYSWHHHTHLIGFAYWRHNYNVIIEEWKAQDKYINNNKTYIWILFYDKLNFMTQNYRRGKNSKIKQKCDGITHACLCFLKM